MWFVQGTKLLPPRVTTAFCLVFALPSAVLVGDLHFMSMCVHVDPYDPTLSPAVVFEMQAGHCAINIGACADNPR